ncbi:MAG: hypothetical protein AABX89_06100 [Candidatus Thermoplasmatota archaeon]
MAEVLDAVSYELLQDLLRSERRSNKLVVLAPRFWSLAREFLAASTAAFQAEQAKDPFGRPVMLLTDRVKNARHAAESLWALRERKLAMLALAATKESKRPEGITPDEAALYSQMLSLLEGARVATFGELLATRSLAPPPLAVPGPPAPPPAVQMPILETPASTAAAAGPVQVPADTPAGARAELVTIRALGDIPPFVGPDMQTYLLKSGDIATVPPSIAQLLVRRSKASIIPAS